ncbi:MAG TPA: tetratricopeptide repeat protein [Pyrinomonadaceae bacterium]|nr:tetratricopeptide repeat protein [Pyrinomonadaceae bacterium]
MKGLVEKSCLILMLTLFSAASFITHAQAVGAHRGDNAIAGGRRTIKGQIYLSQRDEKGEIRFRIRLENPDMGKVTTVTDSDGQFTFNGISAGSYNLTVEETSGYESAHESVYVDSMSSGPLLMVPIYLRRKPSADPTLAGIPNAAIDAYSKGMEASQKNESQKAIDHLKTAIAAYQPFLQAYNELAVQFLKAGDLEKAGKALDSALKLKPHDFEANLNSGIVLLQNKKFEEAARPLKLAIEQRKTAATPHYYLGVALLNLKQIDEAQQELETTIKLPGGNNLAQAHRYLGGIYWSKREYKRAADELEAYLKLAPKAPDAERTKSAIKELRSKQ